MRNLLVYLLLSLPFWAHGQAVDNPRVKIRATNGNAVLYEATSDTPKGTYPATVTGRNQFQIDIKNGLWNLTLDNGAVIPKGMKPPTVMPVPSGLVGPSWASLRYTMTGDELYVEGAGSELAKLQFKRVDGTKITGTNPNGVNVNDVDFFGFGSNNDATFNKQWKVTFSPSIIGKAFRITAQKNDGTLFVKEFPPVASASKTILYLAPGSTTTPPTSTTSTIAYDQSFESESATLSNSGQDVFTFNDPGASSGDRIACCFSRADTYIDYTLSSVAGAGNLTLELRYQTNTPDPAVASITAGGQTQSLNLSGTSGGKSTATISVPVIAGNNTIRIAGSSGTFLQDKIRLSGSISVVTNGGSTGGGGSTTTPPTTTTYPSYTLGLMLGNSITTYTASTVPGNWPYNNAMAVDAPQYDNAHVVEAGLRTVNPSFVLATSGNGSGFEQSYNSSDADAVKNNVSLLKSELARDYPNKVFDPFIFSYGGENTGGTFDATKLRTMFDAVFDNVPRPSGGRRIMRTSFYKGKDQSDAFVRAYCAEKGIDLVDLSDVQERSDLVASEYLAAPYNNAGWAKHPNRPGHALIGGRYLDKLKITTTSPPTSTTVTGNYAYQSPNTEYVSVADQGWDIRNVREKYIENNVIRVGFLRGGAVLSYAAKKSDNRNLMNSYQVVYDDDPSDFRAGQVTDDLGRQGMWFSDYMTPGPEPSGLVFKNGKSTKNGYTPTRGRYVRPGNPWVFNTGNNPVQGGSLFPTMDLSKILASAVYDHPTRGREFYAKIRPKFWAVKDEDSHLVGEIWVSFPDPNSPVIHVYARHHIEEMDPNRFAEQRVFQANEQENPCLYVIAPLAEKIINVGNRTNIAPGGGAVFSSTYHTVDGKIGAYGQGTGVTLFTPRNTSVKAAQFGGFDGDWTSDQSAYINGAVRQNYDNPGIYDDESYVAFGNESEANTALSPFGGVDQSFNFDFSKENVRWWNVDSRLKRESGNNWTWYLDSKTDNGVTAFICKFLAPYRAWQASNISTITFEMAVTGASQFDLIWQKPGVDNGPEYSKRFSVTGDGQFRTYSVPTSDGNWSGIISTVGLKAVTSATSSGAKVIIRKIYK